MKKGTRNAYGQALIELGLEQDKIVVLDADLSKSTKTEEFAKKFPDRFFQMGLHEQDMVSTAAGLAASGLIPFVSSFVVFLTGIAWMQIRQSICLSRHNVKLVATHGGITVGQDGASHQACEDFALMNVLPYMTVLCPADYFEAKEAVKQIAKHEGPAYMRLSRVEFPVLFDENYELTIGKANRVREGGDVALIGTGLMVSHCLEAAEELEKHGISARVINMSTLKPIDQKEIIDAAKEIGAVVSVEEHSVIGGLGSSIASVLSQISPVPLEIMGVPDVFGSSGKPDDLLKHFKLMPEDIVETAKSVIQKKRKE